MSSVLCLEFAKEFSGILLDWEPEAEAHARAIAEMNAENEMETEMEAEAWIAFEIKMATVDLEHTNS